MKHKLTRLTSLMLAFIMAFSMLLVPVEAASFEDVSSSAWYKPYVDYVSERGWMNGVSETQFAPNKEVTRAMFVTVLARYGKVYEDSSLTVFSDVPANKWYTGTVTWAYETGIVTGIGNSRFAPHKSITRQDLCKMLYNFIRFMGYKIPHDADKTFSDMGSVADYAKEAVGFCAAAGLVTGFDDGSFRPKDTATRAQIAAILMRLDMLINGENPPADPMPAQSFSGEAGEDMSISVNAPEGALPEGTNMTVSRVTDEATLATYAESINGQVYAAADISFSKDDEELEPEKMVEVQISLDGLQDIKNPIVYHVNANGTMDQLSSEKISLVRGGNAEALRFYAKDFSVYIIGSGANDAKLLTVKFYDGNDNLINVQAVNLKRMGKYIQDGKALIHDPGVPSITTTQSFEGWKTTDYPDSEKNTNLDVDAINAYIEDHYDANSANATLEYHAMVYEVRYVVYHDQAGAVLMTQAYHVEVENGVVGKEDVKIDWPYVGFKGGQNFAGWVTDACLEKYMENDQVVLDENGNPILMLGDYPMYVEGITDSDIYLNGQTYNINETLQLYPYLNSGHWLIFNTFKDQDLDSTSTTFVAPVFYAEGAKTSAPQIPERTGYEFKGWYKSYMTKKVTNAAGEEVDVVDTWGERFTFGSALNESFTLYARWEPKNTKYTVVFWAQKVTDSVNAAEADKEYDFYNAIEYTAKTGTSVSIETADSGTTAHNRLGDNGDGTIGELGYYFTYNANNTDTGSKVVNGDGSTVLNVYYDRKTITFSYGPSEMHYEQVSTLDWENYNNYYVQSGNSYLAYRHLDNYYYTEHSGNLSQTATYYILYPNDDGTYTAYSYSYNRNYRQFLFQMNGQYYTWSGTVYDRSSNVASTVYQGYPVLTSVDYTISGLYGSQLKTSDWPDSEDGYVWAAYDPGVGRTFRYPLALTEFVPTLQHGQTTTEQDFFADEWSTNVINVYYVGMNLDGTDYDEDLAQGTTTRQGNWYPTETIQGFTIHGYRFGTSGSWTSCRPDDAINVDENEQNDLYIAFDRNNYRLEFISNNQVVTPDDLPAGTDLEQTPYKTPLDQYEDFEPTNGPEGYYFDGWYADSALSTLFDFDTEMPANNVRIYAKWTQIRFRVVVDPTGGQTLTDSQGNTVTDPTSVITIPNGQATTFRIDYGEAVDGTNFNEATREGYTLLGWYLDPEYTTAFEFGTPMTTLGGKADMTYGDADASDRQGVDPWKDNRAYNDADGEHDDVVGKIVIYGKWRQNADGVVGINVHYDATDKNGNTGKFSTDGNPTTWDDPNIYADKAMAFGQPASTPDDTTLQFLYWEILDKNGNVVGKAYPGQLWEVNIANAKVTDLTAQAIYVTAPDAEPEPETPEQTVNAPAADQTSVRSAAPTPVLNTGNREVTTLTTTIFEDNFDNGTDFTSSTSASDALSTEVWTAYNAGSGNNWTISNDSTYAYSGNNSAAYNYNSSYAANCYLISHPFKVSSNASELNVSLWERVRRTTYTTYSEKFEVFFIIADGIGTNDNAVNATHYNAIASATYSNTTYAQQTATLTDLSALAGKNVRLVIHCTSDADRYVLNIDNVSVTQKQTGETVTYELANEIKAGKNYVIVVEDTHAISNTAYRNGLCVNAESVVNNGDGTITLFADQESALLYKVGGSSSGWTLYNQAAGKYLGLALDTQNEYWLSVINTPWEWLYTGTDLDNQCTEASNQADENSYYRYIYYDQTFDDISTAAGTGHNVKFYKIVNEGYTVTFVDGITNEVIDTQIVEEGGNAEAPEAPEHEGYVFTRWEGYYDNVTEDVTVTAVYTAVADLYYTVTFRYMNSNGEWVSEPQQVRHNTAATPPFVTSDQAPQVSGYTFNSWDKRFTNITSNLTISAVYKMIQTKKYVVTLRAVYGMKSTEAKTHIYWYANNGTEDNNGAGVRQEMEPIEINDAQEIPTPANFTYKVASRDGETTTVTGLKYDDHVFLGWARLDNTTGTSQTAHPELLSSDLWLIWHEEDGGYYTVNTANDPDFVEEGGTASQHVAYVAADEMTPYHDMYAVWSGFYYVFHSATGKIEAIEVKRTKTVDQTTGVATVTTNTDNIVDLVTEHYLYGGYYSEYGGVKVDYDLENAEQLAAFKTHKQNCLDKRAAQDRFETLTDKTYSGEKVGVQINDEVVPFWTKNKAGTVSGYELIPTAGTVYYLKEVPESYLTTKYVYTYETLEGPDQNKIQDIFIVTLVDDNNYKKIGFRTEDADATDAESVAQQELIKRQSLAGAFNLVSQGNGENPTYTTTVNAQSFGLSGGYVAVSRATSYISDNNVFSVMPGWITMDQVPVNSRGALKLTVNNDSTAIHHDLLGSVLASNKIYVDTSAPVINTNNHTVWESDKSVTKLYFFGTSPATWVTMTKESDNLYSADIPAGSWNGVIVVRCANGTENNHNWSNAWNQTINISFDRSKNLITIDDYIVWEGENHDQKHYRAAFTGVYNP